MSKRNIEEIVAEAKQWGMLANPADIHTLIAENFALAAENARLREALTESRRFMDYFANGRTSFTGPGTPTSCLAHIDWALNPNRAALSPPIASEQSAPKPTPSDETLWRDLCEKDDRTSPPEYPDIAMVSQQEFVGYLAQARAEEAEACELIALRERNSMSDGSAAWGAAATIAASIRSRYAKEPGLS